MEGEEKKKRLKDGEGEEEQRESEAHKKVSHFLHLRLILKPHSHVDTTSFLCVYVHACDSPTFTVCWSAVCVDVNGVCVGHFSIHSASKCTGFVCLCEFNERVFFVCLHMLLWIYCWL